MRIALGTLGLSLVTAAAMLSNSNLEQDFGGRAPGTLAWGPALFRMLLAAHGLVCLMIAWRWKAQKTPRGNIWRMKRRHGWILAGLSVVAFALRFWALNTGLWLDEALTLIEYVRRPFPEIVTSFHSQNQHMLYSVLAWGSTQLFGEHPWTLRLPSVFFGVGSIWGLFLLGRKLAGARQALLACGLMTVSYHHIWFSQNARGYMGLLFFAILATWLWLEARTEHDWRLWTGYAIACCLGMWVHMTMVFVVLAHALISVPELFSNLREKNWARLWQPPAAWLLAASLSAQVYALTLPEFFHSAAHEVSMESEWTNPMWVVTESLRSLRTGFAGAAILIAGGAFLFAGWWNLWRRSRSAALAMVLPGLLGGASMLALGHNLWPRFFFFSMGFALLIVIAGAIAVPEIIFRRRKIAQAAGLAGALLLIAASAATVPRCYALPKQDFAGARDFVERHRTPGDAVVVVGVAGPVYKQYLAPHWDLASTAAELTAISAKHADVSVIYSLPIELKAFRPEIWKVVETQFEPIRIFPGTLSGGEVYVCRLRAPGRPVAAGYKHADGQR